MAIQITDDGATIKFVKDGVAQSIDKEGISNIIVTGPIVSIRMDNERQVDADFNQVTVPVTVSAEALRAVIEAMLDTNPTTVLLSAILALLSVGVPTTPAVSTTTVQTSVAASAVSTVLKAANALRKGLTIFNDGNQTLFVHLDASAATTTNQTVEIGNNEYYEVPFNYTGEVRGIWNVANGSARITEFT